MNRDTLIRLADALEDVMCETGRGSTEQDRKLWAMCHPLWLMVQKILRRMNSL